MCLSFLTTEEPLTASSDKTVYKWLTKRLNINKINEYLEKTQPDQNLLTCTVTLAFGTVKVPGYLYKCDDYFFILHNDSRFIGSLPKVTPRQVQFSYSWALDFYVREIKCEDITFTNDFLITPFQQFPVEIGQTYKSSLNKIGGSVHLGLHSFVFLEDAEKNSKKGTGDTILVECIIPKGAEYYVGVFDNSVSIASNQLKYVKLCV